MIRLARAVVPKAAAAQPLPHSFLPSSSATISSSNSNNRPNSFSSSSASSTKKNVTAAAADRRLAGRRRFYKHVGIAPALPPGHHRSAVAAGGGEEEVESPISAGVDGTQSASGVTNALPPPAEEDASSNWATLLHPRRWYQRRTHPSNNEHQSSSSSSSWHTITLDNRALRTPLGLPLSLPSLPLALAVASEWDAQSDYLRPAQMPLMTLCCTAIDQVASNPQSHRTDILRYLSNDTSCYWSDPTCGDRVLHRKQLRAWDTLHENVSTSVLGLPKNSDVMPAFAIGEGEAISLSRSSNNSGGSSGLPHPPILVSKATKWVHSLDAWMLSALFSACAESKSFFIGAALIHEAMNGGVQEGAPGADDDSGEDENDAIIASIPTTNREERESKKENAANNSTTIVRDGKWAVEAARVEEEFNIECWGLVEGGHDYDRLNCSIQMHAASFLARTVASG